MTLKIISPQEIVFEGEVRLVSLPGAMGEFTILKNHASLISTLTAGVLRYVDADGNESTNTISGGIVDVDNNIVSVCLH